MFEISNLDDIIYKCIFIEEGENCKQEKKVCTEIKFGGNKEICEAASVSDSNTKKCISKNNNGECEEIIKESNKDNNLSNKLNFLFSIIGLLYFI